MFKNTKQEKISHGWYPINFLGLLVLALQGSVVSFLFYVLYTGELSTDNFGYQAAIVFMIILVCVMFYSRKHRQQPFRDIHSEDTSRGGFSLIELLIVIAIIGILASTVISSIVFAKDKAYFIRAKKEFLTMREALEQYQSDFGEYPDDVSRDIPPGLEPYLSTGNWPNAPWPGSIYDWDNWDDPDNAGEKIYQISIRFCPLGGTIDECRFPQASWADDFDVQSSVYYCLAGACRAHIGKPIDHPGYCVNCD